MSKTNYHMNGLEIRFDQETEVVETLYGIRKPDLGWRHFDSNGHAHGWRHQNNVSDLPTLDWVVTGKGYYDDGTEYNTGVYRCRVCEEKVEPKYTRSYEPEYVTGPPRYTLVLGGNEYPLADEDVAPLVEIMRRCGVIK